jgi:hypothetical protein
MHIGSNNKTTYVKPLERLDNLKTMVVLSVTTFKKNNEEAYGGFHTKSYRIK